MSQRRQSVIFFSSVLLICLLITGLMRPSLHDSPPPGIADLCLVVVLAIAYRYSWKLAAALAGVSLLFGAWLSLPLDGLDRLELATYAACAGVVLGLTATLRRHRA